MFYDEFARLSESLSTSNYLISGDFNFHMNKDNPDTLNFKELIDTAALVRHVNTVTHDKGHILDLLITPSDNDLIWNLRSSFELPSGHAVLTCHLDFPRPMPFKAHSKYRRINNIDLASFGTEFSALPLFHQPKHDLNSSVLDYNTSLRGLLDKHAPVCERTVIVRSH